MTLIRWMVPVFAIALVAGCEAPGPAMIESHCHLTEPLYYDDEHVLVWLQENDPMLVRDILRHNETWEAMCP